MHRRKRPRKCFIAELAGYEELLWLKPNWIDGDLEIKFTRLLFRLEIFSTDICNIRLSFVYQFNRVPRYFRFCEKVGQRIIRMSKVGIGSLRNKKRKERKEKYLHMNFRFDECNELSTNLMAAQSFISILEM